jgi:hypothetical protein
MRRTSLGLITLLLLVVGTITLVSGPDDANARGFAAGCIRVGLVLGALWLALPQIVAIIRRAPSWAWNRFFSRRKGASNEASANGPRPKRPRRRSNV